MKNTKFNPKVLSLAFKSSNRFSSEWVNSLLWKEYNFSFVLFEVLTDIIFQMQGALMTPVWAVLYQAVNSSQRSVQRLPKYILYASARCKPLKFQGTV